MSIMFMVDDYDDDDEDDEFIDVDEERCKLSQQDRMAEANTHANDSIDFKHWIDHLL